MTERIIQSVNRQMDGTESSVLKGRNVRGQWTHEKVFNMLSPRGNAIITWWRFHSATVQILSSWKNKNDSKCRGGAGEGTLQGWWEFKMVQPLWKLDLSSRVSTQGAGDQCITGLVARLCYGCTMYECQSMWPAHRAINRKTKHLF